MRWSTGSLILKGYLMRSLTLLLICTLALLSAHGESATVESLVITPTASQIATPQGIALKVGGDCYLEARGLQSNGALTEVSVQWTLLSGPGSLRPADYPGDPFIAFLSGAPGNVVVQATDLANTAISARFTISVYQPQLTNFFTAPTGYFGYSSDLKVMELPDAVNDFAASEGVDQYGVAIPIPPVTWSLSPASAGTISAQGVTQLNPGPVQIIGSAGGATVVRNCNNYIPVVTRMSTGCNDQFSYRVTARASSPVQLNAFVYDQFNLELIPTPTLTWTTSPGSDGTVDQSGLFTPFAGAGTANVYSSVNGVTSSPAIITVVVPSATTLGLDPYTVGDWFHQYGMDGSYKAGDDLHLTDQSVEPQYYLQSSEYTFYSVGNVAPLTYVEMENTDGRALACSVSLEEGDNPLRRVVAYWSSPAAFQFPVDFKDAIAHEVAFYLLDWQRQGLSERVDIVNPDTGAVLATSGAVSNFANGVYARFSITGRVAMRITPLTPNLPAILSGIFYGSAFDASNPE
jgi:hypothetical protein